MDSTNEIRLWTGVAPGFELHRQIEKESPFPGGQFSVVRNVTTPTLTAHLPLAELATGTGVIIAPGGGFRFLSMGAEGHDVAHWLAQRGIAAFVLKYRTVETPEVDLDMWLEIQATLAGGGGRPFLPSEDAKAGVADGQRAIEIVRRDAAEWGLSPDRIGFLGFSAGGIIASYLALLASGVNRPDFVAPIYGAPFGDSPVIPASLPPIFLACSSDDALMIDHVHTFSTSLRRAGHHPEMHIYREGGHGFGLNKQGKSSDFWIDDFYNWLRSLGYANRAP